MPKLHVLLKREELDPARLDGKVIIVLDILFATTTIVHAFAQGACRIHPVRTPEEGLQVAERVGPCLLAGEHLAQAIPGYAQATPMALARFGLEGVEIIYCTTNGTQALASVAHAGHVYVGSMLNGKALVAHVVAQHADASVLIICSGSLDRFNLEDFHGAGHLIAHFTDTGNYAMTDTAFAALHAYRGSDTRSALLNSRVGQMMAEHDLVAEIDYASQRDTLDTVPTMIDGTLVRIQS
ncbi:2-phosphosulfolactate phosphatase [Dokdonella sp.]|uniref:2-phosphosulfolactate phosphatase n=1 Tax=Dokdonella sp. TaxID=2291710 RepID=UPI003C441A0B